MSAHKEKIIAGFFYRFAERAGAQGVGFLVSLVLARLILPSEYGAIALVTIIITICSVFVTYGFGNSLIVNRNSDSIDFSTCFYFGIFLSVVIYAIIFVSAPYIATFYNIDILSNVIRVMGLSIIISAINSVQHAFVSKHLMFKKFFHATLLGTISSGVIAIVMAYQGYGIWALVEQYIGKLLVDTICLWIIVGWRPERKFSFGRLKVIYSYGWKILVVGLIDTGYSQLRSLVIGKRYSSIDLAYYNKGNQFPQFGIQLIEPTINGVLFPSLAQCKDQEEMRSITRRIIKVSCYVIFPTMIGLAAVAKPLITVLLTEKWLNSVLYLQLGCIAMLFRPLQFINNCVVRASGRSELLLKLDIMKKSIGVILLIISIPFGVFWIAISLVVTNLISTIINIAPNRRILDYGYKMQFFDIIGNLILAAVMGVVVYVVSYLPIPDIFLLISQIITGITMYICLSFITKNEEYRYCIRILKNFHVKLKKARVHNEKV